MAPARGDEAGEAWGRTAGYREARDEEAAATWAGTPEGRAAYRLGEVEQIQDLSTCARPGWFTQNGIGYPHTDPDGKLWGWRLPLKTPR